MSEIGTVAWAAVVAGASALGAGIDKTAISRDDSGASKQKSVGTSDQYLIFESESDAQTGVTIVTPGMLMQQSRALEMEFEKSLDEYLEGTRVASSVHAMKMLPSYSRTIGFGPTALPWLLEKVDSAPVQIFPMLLAISRENPAEDVAPGDVVAMISCWKKWGQEQGLC